MRIKIGSEYSPRVGVYLDTVKHEDKGEVAGMLRGLMCSIEGWGAISGLTNEKFAESEPLILKFSSVENAHYFKSCVDYYFSDEILERLRVTKRIYRI
jgi:hypothetical protein